MGLRPHDKLDGKKAGTKFIIAIGTENFTSIYGLPSIHSACGDFIIHKARRMNIGVVGIDEVYTSKTCPKCLSHSVKQVLGHHHRVLYCKECQTHFHRDIMAGEDHALICRYVLDPSTKAPPAC